MPKNTAPKGLPALFQPIDLTEGPCWKTILRFSFPIILSYLLQQVYSISDAAIVGQTLSGEQVAGVNDIAPIVNIFLQFAFGVSAGFCVITSCNVGSHNQPGVRRSLATQIVLSAVLTLLLTALALALLNPMLAWINVTRTAALSIRRLLPTAPLSLPVSARSFFITSSARSCARWVILSRL